MIIVCLKRLSLSAAGDQWTVHGIWPSRPHKKAPVFCIGPSFDSSQITPILPELETHWTDIHKNSPKFGFWEHEWNKHGKCAMEKQSARMENELKYFRKGNFK